MAAVEGPLAGMLATLRGTNGEEVKVSDGTATITATAILGQTEWQSEDRLGGVQNFTSRDFIFETGDLVFEGVQKKPDRGWTVTRSDGRIYNFMHPDDLAQTYRRTDQHDVGTRVHTKLSKA